MEEGAKLVPMDFTIAFLCVALVSALSFFSFRALPEDAGSELTGVRIANVPSKEAAQPGA
jgi:hypothetical protein